MRTFFFFFLHYLLSRNPSNLSGDSLEGSDRSARNNWTKLGSVRLKLGFYCTFNTVAHFAATTCTFARMFNETLLVNKYFTLLYCKDLPLLLLICYFFSWWAQGNYIAAGSTSSGGTQYL